VAVLTTALLRVRPLHPGDAAFIVALLNDEAFRRNIGDRGVRSEADAIGYITRGPLASYSRHGFGLDAVELPDTGAPIGICGLLQRDQLPAPDLGFAFLPQYRSRGYAYEATTAVKADAHGRLAIATLLAVVNPANAPSIRLLERLGFAFERSVRLSADGPMLKLFAAHAAPAEA